jgi:endonuclease YncB( thermonuclease family)
MPSCRAIEPRARTARKRRYSTNKTGNHRLSELVMAHLVGWNTDDRMANRQLTRPFGLTLLASFCFGCWSPVHAQLLQASVLSIGDGDTIRVRQAGRPLTVRLACIDAPEMAQRPFGEQARRQLQRRLPLGSPVRLDIKATDRYGRVVAEVIAAININLALVEDGQAFAYRRYLRGCDGPLYLAAEQRASRRRRGIWQQPGGISRPWEFRRRPRHTGTAWNPPHGCSSADPAGDGGGGGCAQPQPGAVRLVHPPAAAGLAHL